MKVLDPGHQYELHALDGFDAFEILTFVKREGPGFPGNVGSYPGTTVQEVCRALIDRLQYVDKQIYDIRNGFCIQFLKSIIWLLERRAAERHGRELKAGLREIESLPFCERCGHVECEGHK